MTDMQAWLDQGKTLADQATEGPWEADGSEVTRHLPPPNLFQYVVGPIGVIRSEDGAFITDSRTRLPQALNAIQAVLDLHKPHVSHLVESMDGFFQQIRESCEHCDVDYPCPTVLAIQTAIEEQSC